MDSIKWVVLYLFNTLRVWFMHRDLSVQQAKERVNNDLLNEECQGLEVALDEIKDGRPIGASPEQLRQLMKTIMNRSIEMAPNYPDTFERCFRAKQKGEMILESKGL